MTEIVSMIGVVTLAAATVLLVWRLITRAEKQWAETTVRTFSSMFPGRCLICSYHRYGISNGYVDPKAPPPDHVCVEHRED